MNQIISHSRHQVVRLAWEILTAVSPSDGAAGAGQWLQGTWEKLQAMCHHKFEMWDIHKSTGNNFSK